MNILKLSNGQRIVYVNMERIVSFQGDNGWTILYTDERNGAAALVKETPEQILAMLERKYMNGTKGWAVDD